MVKAESHPAPSLRQPDHARTAVEQQLAAYETLVAALPRKAAAERVAFDTLFNVVRYVPAESVLKLDLGDTIALTAADFERHSAAFFAELEKRFL